MPRIDEICPWVSEEAWAMPAPANRENATVAPIAQRVNLACIYDIYLIIKSSTYNTIVAPMYLTKSQC